MSGSTAPDRQARRGAPPARPGGLGRLAALTLVATAAGGALLLRAAALAPRSPAAAAGLSVDGWVELAVLAAGLVAAAWLAASGVLALVCVAASMLGRRWRAGEAAVERLAPAAVRRLVRSAVGMGVGAGLALAPTAALASDVPPSSPVSDGASVVLDLGWQPTAADDSAPGSGTTPPDHPAVPVDEEAAEEAATETAQDAVEEVVATPVARHATDDDSDGGQGATTHVVLRGDTLWDIAARSLGDSPTDAEVLREVTRWHAENRDVIGADPDRLLPGQVLHAPA
ncbi:LysM peptidoglycan-binding domain-containing protein [Isoptericola sp. NPDC019693]|uniref:LysM peptidoglycan-binding domain-containing protein n=1 Tax=Isoptericola sp. NPDC019693 TaxID=3364009 RepID=UPI0037A5887F